MQLKIIIASFLLLIGIIIYAVWSGSQVNSDSINNCHETLTTIKKRATEGDAIAQATLNFMRKKIGDGSDSSLLKYMANSAELAQRGNTEADILNQLLEVASGQRSWEDIDKQPLTKALLQNSDQTNPEQQFQLGVLYHQMHDYPEALKWLELSANQGNAEAQAMLGFMYRDGKGVKIDYAESQKWLELAAINIEDTTIWAELGVFYFNFNDYCPGVKVDPEKGYYWINKAAENKNAGAQCIMGLINLHGVYVEQDYKEAYHWFTLSAEKNYSDATLDLGWMYENGFYVKKDIPKALEYYKTGAELGNYNAYYMIGIIYEKGTEVEKDIPKAKEYYQKGAALGDQDAIDALSRLSTDTESLDK